MTPTPEPRHRGEIDATTVLICILLALLIVYIVQHIGTQ